MTQGLGIFQNQFNTSVSSDACVLATVKMCFIHPVYTAHFQEASTVYEQKLMLPTLPPHHLHLLDSTVSGQLTVPVIH